MLYPTDKILANTLLPFLPQWVTPNYFTTFRILVTPLVVFLLWRGYFYTGLILFVITASTDAIDGALARTRNQITNLGKILDPLADKLLIGSVVLVLVYTYMDVSLAIATVGMELLIILVAIAKKIRGRLPQANVWGKIKMVLQTLGITLLLLFIITAYYPLFISSILVFSLSLVFGFISLLTYSA